MKRALFFFLGLPLFAFGEDPGDARQPQGQAIIIQQQSNQGNQVPYRGVPIFSDDVFKSVGKDAPPTGSSKSIYTGTVRALEAEGQEFNSGQYKRWRQQCKGAMNQDPKLGRECFEQAKETEARSIQAQKDAVEQRQKSPYRNMQSDPVSEAQGAGGSSYGGSEPPTE